jgi:hypothetical protein
MPAGFGDADAVKTLRAMAPVDHRNLDEVLRSVDFDVKAREEYAR